MKKSNFDEQLYSTPQLRIVKCEFSGVFTVSNPTNTEDMQDGGTVDWFN